MEADWSVEVGRDLPMIEIPWEGFLDLRLNPSAVIGISETAGNAALRDALLALNAEATPLMTSKCDTWLMAADEIDPYEYEAGEDAARAGVACYIDLVLRSENLFSSFPVHERWVRDAVSELHERRLPQARADYVIRPACVYGIDGFGITLYVSACAETASAVQPVFQAALRDAIAVTIKTAATAGE